MPEPSTSKTASDPADFASSGSEVVPSAPCDESSSPTLETKKSEASLGSDSVAPPAACVTADKERLEIRRSYIEQSGAPLERTVSPSSTLAISDTKEDINGSLHDSISTPSFTEKSSRTPSAPSLTIPTPDSAFSGPVSAELEAAVGTAATSTPTVTPQQTIQSQLKSEGGPLQPAVSPPPTTELAGQQPQSQPHPPPQQDCNDAMSNPPTPPQHFTPVTEAQPVLVAVPLAAQSPASAMVDAGPQPESAESGGQSLQQPAHPTVVYQIPGLVTVPMAPGTHAIGETMAISQPTDGNAPMAAGTHAMRATMNTSQPTNGNAPETPAGLQQPSLGTKPPEQIIGMVGAIPIVKLQAPPQSFVKQKKGRFKLLQETPAASTTASAPPSNCPIPANSSVPRGQSMTSTVSQSSVSAQTPQTFDGTSAPTVKKKGRFVVTNVKDPVSIQRTLETKHGKPPVAPTIESGQTQSQPHVHQTQVQTVQGHHVQPPLHPSAGQDSQANPATPMPTPQSTNKPVIAPQELQPSNSSLGPEASTSIGVTAPQTPNQGASLNLPQTQVHLPVQQYQTFDASGSQPQLPPHVPHVPQMANEPLTPKVAPPTSQTPTPPPTPAGKAANVESPIANVAVPTPVPSVPIPKPPPNVEKSRSASVGTAAKKWPQQPRPGKMPQTIDSNGMLSSVGLGKVFYFLDQMKAEVTETDQMIKTMQTDMKLLRDKNKELEAKNRDLEHKLREEKAFREKVEARNIELRRKMRDAKNESSIGIPRPTDKPADESCVPRSRADSVERSTIVPSKMQPISSVQTPVGGEGRKPGAASDNGGASTGSKVAPNPTKGTGTQIPMPRKGLPPRREEPLAAPEPGIRHVRSDSGGQEGEHLTLDRIKSDLSAVSDIPESTGASQTKESQSTPHHIRHDSGPPSMPIQARPPATGPTTAPRAPTKQLSMNDFDPMKRNPSDLLPDISIPTQVSLGAVPLGSSASFQQNAQDSGFTCSSTLISSQYDQGAFVTETPVMVPAIALGTHYPGGANGVHSFQKQQFMVLPQQQPLMLHRVHGAVQPKMFAATGQWNNVQQNSQTVSSAGSQSQQQGNGQNPFDAFADPYDDFIARNGNPSIT